MLSVNISTKGLTNLNVVKHQKHLFHFMTNKNKCMFIKNFFFSENDNKQLFNIKTDHSFSM